MKTKKIPTKNYIILFGVIVLIICACFAANNLYDIYKENKLSNSPLSSKSVLYEDLRNATKDISADTFLIISYTQDSLIYENEKEIKSLLKKKNLIDNVMYLDVTDKRDDENLISELNSMLVLDGNLAISSLPAVVYYKEGIPTKTEDSRSNILNADNFQQIIDMYELAS